LVLCNCHIYGFVTQIRWTGDKLFELCHTSALEEQFVVKIDKKECTCRKWRISGIQCYHALSAMKFLNMNAKDFISHWFRKSTYEQTYTSIVYPINGQKCGRLHLIPMSCLKRKEYYLEDLRKREDFSWEIKMDDTQLA